MGTTVFPTFAETQTEPRTFEPDVPAPAVSDAPAPPAEAVPGAAPDAPTPDVAPPAADVPPPAEAVPTEPVAAPITDRSPLIVTAAGQSFPIEGSYTLPTGEAVIPKQLWARVQQLASRGIQHERTLPDLERREAEVTRRMADADTSVSTREVEFTKLVEHLEPILGELMQLVPNAGPAIQKAIYEAQLAAKSHELTQWQNRGKPTPEKIAEQTRNQAAAGMTDVLTAAAAAPAYAAMMADPLFSQKVHGKLMRRAQAMVKVENGRVTNESVAAIDAELADLLDDFRERQAFAPAKAPNGTAAALAAAAAKPAPGKAPSVATSTTTPRNGRGRFANLHPDAPPEAQTDIEVRTAWIRKREKQGLPITADD